MDKGSLDTVNSVPPGFHPFGVCPFYLSDAWPPWPLGQITARLGKNRQVEFDRTERRHFSHRYGVTCHSAQGITAERVLIHADTGDHPDLLNSPFG
ncbi:MAG: hypothetical protein WCF17_18035 [Terracidiphilus sp.]